MKLILLFISAAVVNNFVLSYFLGIRPFVGVSKKVSSAVSMGMAVTFVMTIAAAVTWLIYHLILVPAELEIFRMVPFLYAYFKMFRIKPKPPPPDKEEYIFVANPINHVRPISF